MAGGPSVARGAGLRKTAATELGPFPGLWYSPPRLGMG
jgi:hypothetical protein